MSKVKINIEYEDGEKSFEIKKGTLKVTYDTGDGTGEQDDPEYASTFDIIPMADALKIVSVWFNNASNAKRTEESKDTFFGGTVIGNVGRTISHYSYFDWGFSAEIMTIDGYGFVRVSYDYYSEHWFISDLFVNREERERGIGNILVNEAVRIAGTKNVHYRLGGNLFVHEWLQDIGFICDDLVFSRGGKQ